MLACRYESGGESGLASLPSGGSDGSVGATAAYVGGAGEASLAPAGIFDTGEQLVGNGGSGACQGPAHALLDFSNYGGRAFVQRDPGCGDAGDFSIDGMAHLARWDSGDWAMQLDGAAEQSTSNGGVFDAWHGLQQADTTGDGAGGSRCANLLADISSLVQEVQEQQPAVYTIHETVHP